MSDLGPGQQIAQLASLVQQLAEQVQSWNATVASLTAQVQRSNAR
jgi:hypothetical protein